MLQSRNSVSSIDHSEANESRKSLLDQEKSSRVDIHQRTEQEKQTRAEELHRLSVEERRKNASKSLADGEECKTRKALHDSLLASETHEMEHKLELKQELAEAKRNDLLEGIKQKQKHLQGQ